jgi:hypothetical protein
MLEDCLYLSMYAGEERGIRGVAHGDIAGVADCDHLMKSESSTSFSALFAMQV